MTTCLHKVLNLYKENRWKEILDLRKTLDLSETRKLLWVWPSESNLKFIKQLTVRFALRGIISIGCGCGLLEWILQKSTGLDVIGFEVNEEWWKSKYCNPQFIELQFPQMPPSKSLLERDYALLFCYFNNGEAFKDYIRSYEGDLVIIIGPGNGAGRHTNPEPFKPDFGSSEWTLFQVQEVEDTKDFIAAYIRNNNNSVICNNLLN